MDDSVKEENKKIKKELDFGNHISWLRPAVLGANDGVISIASMMVSMIVGHAALKVVTLAGVAALVAGSMAMATGEYVSVSSQSDALEALTNKEPGIEMIFIKPFQAAIVSAASFIAGGIIPLLVTITAPNNFLLPVVIILSLSTLAILGALGAKIGKVKIFRPTIRILLLGVISLTISTMVGLLFD